MTDLKTLNDIFNHDVPYGSDRTFIADKLRQEAIKWLKEIDNFRKSSIELMWEEMTGKTIEYSKDSIMGLRNWIKRFFNLTEEDLK